MEVDHKDLKEDLLPLRAVKHVELYCGNAKQSAYYYRLALGFSFVAYQGPETGVRDRVSYVLQQDKITLVLTTPIRSDSPITDFLVKHGDGVRDIALETSDAEKAYNMTTERGAKSVAEPYIIEDENGKMKLATVEAYGDTVHTFVENMDYAGPFMPKFQATPKDTLARPVGLTYIDHIVGNMDWNKMDEAVDFYQNVFGFSKFVSFDDKDISTEYSALRSTVVSNQNKWIKFPINEPAEGMRKSQIEEYVTFNNGPGVQHVAMSTDNIIETISKMRAQGVDFLNTPSSYYDDLLDRVGDIDEQLKTLAELGILVDRDDKGYMLQLFTKPVEDRPTLFFEIIQRKGAESFGKGNFKALFESIEREQERRGNL
ncbi:MAG: 4-hydroxyphenylpyruvate dioxygenase [Ectothiorhodospiraceae bacterium]|nr:4-hydroxyphenylpyruvate dioxygenase [Ectothiorhodospiraceae bacterium]